MKRYTLRSTDSPACYWIKHYSDFPPQYPMSPPIVDETFNQGNKATSK